MNNVHDVETRDHRFRQIMKKQLGENGLALIVNMSFLFILCIFIMILMLLSTVAMYSSKTQPLRRPVIVDY